jgi:hypothetical protein
MADDRLTMSWRNWVADPTDDNAQAYCTEVGRSGQAPAKTNKLSEVPWASLGIARHERVQEIFEATVEKYMTTDLEDTFVEDLHWLSACHFWLAGSVTPTVARGIAKVFEHYGMELRDGDEEKAEEDVDRARSLTHRGSASARKLRKQVDDLEGDLRTARSKARESHDLEIQLKNAEGMRDHHKKRADRLYADVQKLEKFRGTQHEYNGLKANYEKLKKENERLAKIIQGKAK